MMREHCFGWDPVFQPKGWETSYAEMTKEEKNSLGHQYNVLDKLGFSLLRRDDKESNLSWVWLIRRARPNHICFKIHATVPSRLISSHASRYALGGSSLQRSCHSGGRFFHVSQWQRYRQTKVRK